MITATLAAAGMLAACAAEDSPSEPDTSSSPNGHGSYADCLNAHGVPATPGPNTGPPAGVDRAAWDQALKECASLAPGPG
ncbi:hypothetical protein [Mycolicibacterium litorale]|nr:hypothetical protein BCL50_2681 [Mycolicibacterium litorale]